MTDKFQTKTLVPGRNIYLHNKKTIYCDRHTNQNYIIREGDVRGYTYYSIRHFLAFAIGYTAAILTSNILLGLGLGLIFWGVMSWLFYYRYLPKLSIDESFRRPPQIPYTDSLAQRLSAGRLLTAGFVSVTLGIVIVMNAVINEYPTVILALNVVFALGAAYLGGCCFVALFKKKKAEKQ